MRIVVFLVWAAALPAQSIFPSGLIRFAGRDASRDLGDGPSGYYASFINASTFVRDGAGNFYVGMGPRIRKLDPTGAVTTIAENLVSVYRLALSPGGGFVFVGDRGQIQKLSGNGTFTTIGGSGFPDYNGDGMPALATNMAAAGIAVDAVGQIYFSDPNQRRVRTIRADGNVYTVAGTGATGTGGEGGPAAQAQLLGPFDLAFDGAGNLLIADSKRIVKVDTKGVLTRVAGDPNQSLGSGPPPTGVPAIGAALFATVMALDGAGNLYIRDGVESIVKITADGILHSVAGAPFSSTPGFTEGCGDASKARIFAQGIQVDAAGNVYVLNGADDRRVRIQKITPAGRISTIAGAGPSLFSGDGGPASEATFHRPSGVAADFSGRVYIADSGNNRIRRVDADGTVRTIAGDGGATYDQDPACIADREDLLRNPGGVAVDRAGNVYIADTGNDRIRRIAANGVQSTVAVGIKGVSGVAVDATGKLYASDPSNGRVVRVEADGTLTTIANIVPTGAPAFDNAGRMLIPASHEVDMLLADGRITAVAGTGESFSESQFEYFPSLSHFETIDSAAGVAVDSAGSIYTVDAMKRVIQRTTASCAMSIDPAAFVAPVGIAPDAAGNLYIADPGAETIWKGTPAPSSAAGPMPRLAVKRPVGSLAAASATSIAPGELVRIAGACIGPFDPVVAAYEADGKLPTTLGGTRVVIDGMPAPLFSVSAGSIVAQVPFELAGIVHVVAPNIQVFYKEVEDHAPYSQQDFAPTLFTAGAGAGPVLAANQDGSLNTASRPVQKGSIVILYGTGFGQTVPAGATGRPAPLNSLQFVSGELQVTIGGAPAPVLSAVAAPGFAGLTQINVRVPFQAAGSGAAPLQFTFRGIASNQEKLTVWVAP